MKIAPSILSADFSRLAEEIARVEAAGADQLHVDVMDGRFVPNLTFGPMLVDAIRRSTSLPLDVHLMIEDADRWVEAFAQAGADAIAVHPEALYHTHLTVSTIRKLGKRSGLALNPGTALATIGDILGEIDYVVLMSVNPGWGGQSFIKGSFERAKRLREMADRLNPKLEIEIDGGMHAGLIPAAASAGIDTVIAGSAIFKAHDPAAAVKEMIEVASAAATPS